jgi:hypothetical protein
MLKTNNQLSTKCYFLQIKKYASEIYRTLLGNQIPTCKLRAGMIQKAEFPPKEQIREKTSHTIRQPKLELY